MKKDKERRAFKTVTDLISQYIKERRLTNTSCTVKNDIQTFKLFIINYLHDYLKQPEKDLRIESFGRENIEGFMLWLKEERHNKPQTCNVRLAGLKHFMSRVSEDNPRYISLYDSIKKIKPYKNDGPRLEPVLSKEAIMAIYKAAYNCNQTGKRYAIMIVFAYDIGGRIDEVLACRVTDFDFSSKVASVTVTGKGRKPRILTLHSNVAKLLKQYIESNPETTKENNFVFGQNGHLNLKRSEQGINRQLKKYAAIAKKTCPDVPLNLHFHQFRKACATHMLEEGVSIEIISEWLGHESYETTMKYLGITQAMQFDAINRVVPESMKNEQAEWDSSEMEKLYNILGINKK